MLDAIRAAEQFAGEAPTILLEGHSQGAHAVLATLASAADYAPELPIRAAVALALPGAPRDLLGHLVAEDRWGGFAGMALVGWSYAHPELGAPEDWVTDDRLLDDLDQDCLLGLGGRLDDAPSDVLVPGAVDALPDDVLDAEDLGDLTTDAELLIVHGTDDDLLPLALTAAYVDRIAVGTKVTFVPIDGGDHLLLPRTASDVVLPFLEDAL